MHADALRYLEGMEPVSGAVILARVEQAAMAVQERVLRATAALRAAKIPYAVVGGNAVASWVGRKDPGAIRHTRDVDILVNRSDLPAINHALEAAGFVHLNGPGFDVFRDGPEGKPSEGIHLLFANERIFGDDAILQPDTSDSVDMQEFRVVSLEALVRMKLTVNRDKDRTHIRDLIGVGWIDATWLPRLPPLLAERLKSMLDTPNG
ncbi:MAG TPA: nucleotidyl transferase AbiEii/AbiGii toxin family protein [Phycisphaerales bacterium]|jgi:hypothetical protein|nr:nucleotidyl transferase AbiEii/AbiGii toxin family protein [Phycisphaerales bacterium]